MEVFVKSFASWRTIKQATVLSSDLVLDSVDKESSTLTVAGNSINRSDAGNWLIINGSVYWVSQVKPQEGKTTLTLLAPLDAFSRMIQFSEQAADQTIGGFVAAILRKHWTEGEDPVYSTPYLAVSDSDTTPFVPPELDSAGLFDLAAYCRLMRKAYHVAVTFRDAGAQLACSIGIVPAASRQVSFSDGRSQLRSVDYASSGTAKITVLQDGAQTDWYLSAAGEILQEAPAQRAEGEWKTISVASGADPAAKVAETFAKGRTGQKVEFFSELDLAVLDNCKFLIAGETLPSYISCKRKRSGDARFHYKAGSLATTATEKLRGVK